VLLLVRALRGSLWEKAALLGLALSVIMDLQLLFPNPVMPWPVRSVHMVEVGVSNFVFGVLAAAIVLSGARARSA
jgi:ABC-type Co2+ transport system permease subunit